MRYFVIAYKAASISKLTMAYCESVYHCDRIGDFSNMELQDKFEGAIASQLLPISGDDILTWWCVELL